MRIELQSVSKHYAVPALDAVSLKIEPGCILALLGSNGAGKTTLLRCLGGIVGPDEGQVLYDGEILQRDKLHLRQRLMFLPDFPPVFEDWTPLQHIGMTLRLYGIKQSDIGETVLELLREFDLLPLINASFSTLSRGQRYKASLITVLAVNPEVWLIDEPFASGMDPNGIIALKRHARAATANGRTIIYSTQILDAAERFSDKLCVIHKGKIWAFGETNALKDGEQPKTTALDELFHMLREEEQS